MAMKARMIFEKDFSTPGEVIEGVLIKAQTIRFDDGKSNVEYLVKDGGRILSFRGTTVLNKLLFTSDVGRAVRIKYVGQEAKELKPGMNPKKIFEVDVDDTNPVLQPVLSADGITDDDLPF